MTGETTQDGEITWAEGIGMVMTLLQVPIVATFDLCLSHWTERNRTKTWRRVIGDSAFRLMLASFNNRQLQRYVGTSAAQYMAWARKENLPPVIDELGEDAQLFWLGPKRTKRVILCCHGGGFIIPMAEFYPRFWRHVQLLVEQQTGEEIGLAMLRYSVVPNAPFPTQLCQLISAVNHLISSGVEPQNIQVVGDSAGANLILQLLSHTLHPLPPDLVPPSPLVGLKAPLGGALLVSPWVSLTGDTGSFVANDNTDVLSLKCLVSWGLAVLGPVPESQHVYLEAAKVPESWFSGVNGLIGRFLITTGSKECFRDDDIAFADMLRNHHHDVRVVVEKDGVHDGPLFDFAVNDPKRGGEMKQLMVEWLSSGMDTNLISCLYYWAIYYGWLQNDDSREGPYESAVQPRRACISAAGAKGMAAQ